MTIDYGHIHAWKTINKLAQANIHKTTFHKVNYRQGKEQLKRKYIEKITIVQVYLGNVVIHKGGTNVDVKCSIGKERHEFITIKTVWNTTSFSAANNTNVKRVLHYGSETCMASN